MPTSAAEAPLLEVRDVAVHYGGVRALDGVAVSLAPGEIVALVGPNGAGKSTVLRSIAGFAPIVSGEVRWRGEPFAPVPHRSVARGIAYVPQGRRMLARLTVEENLEVGGYAVRDKKEVRRRVEALMATFPVLEAKRKVFNDLLAQADKPAAMGLTEDEVIGLFDIQARPRREKTETNHRVTEDTEGRDTEQDNKQG